FGESDRLMVGLLQILAWLTWLVIGVKAELGVFWWLALAVAAGLFGYQQWLIRERDRDACFKAFLNNHWVGLALFVAVVLEYIG
ncbi:MAG: 4-hydroxybenzoate octaprenyltransferase, partial [Reinekea sp.]|nr:4-hydroxybenzoate octaprenyltransferase [Reinekea sp.]